MSSSARFKQIQPHLRPKRRRMVRCALVPPVQAPLLASSARVWYPSLRASGWLRALWEGFCPMLHNSSHGAA